MTSRWSRKRKIYAEFQQCLHLISDNDDNDAEHVEIGAGSSQVVQQAALELNPLLAASSSVDSHGLNDDDSSQDNLGTAYNESQTDSEYIYSTSEYETEDSESGSDNESDNPADTKEQCEHLRTKLSNWAVECNITHRALSLLLLILQQYIPSLPKDARTLLKTAKKVDVKTVAGGKYHHIGIQQGIVNVLSQRGCNPNVAVEIQVNVDGLPIFKSSNTQLWPILGKIHNVMELFGSSVSDSPFVIGIYEGKQKPSSAHEYLQEFVAESNALETTGILHSSSCAHNFKISAFICDMPARSFIKCVKGHGAYSGCDRCTQNGIYLGKVTYPDCQAPVRTDDSFRQMVDHVHHIQPSPLTNISVDMVLAFPLDYMHLACLGVTRKLINLWLAGPLRCRLGPLSRKEISDKLLSLAPSMPCDFARKPRSISEYERWKATEFRTFLLYTGPVCLVGSLHEECYGNFMILSVAMTCLLSPILCAKYVDFCRELLVMFVEHFGALYGEDKITYNVHGLVHLPDDSRRYGALDTVSCFPFENCLGMMKRLVRKRSSSLQQIVSRLQERAVNKCDAEKESKEDQVLQQQHVRGPVVGEINIVNQYRQMTIGGFKVCLNGRDNYLRLVNGDIVACENIVTDIHKKVWLIYRTFSNRRSFFSYPLPSEDIGIVQCGSLSRKLQCGSISVVQSKCLLLPYKGSNVAFPILHTAS